MPKISMARVLTNLTQKPKSLARSVPTLVATGCKFWGWGRAHYDKKFALSLTIKGRGSGSHIENVSTSHPYSLLAMIVDWIDLFC